GVTQSKPSLALDNLRASVIIVVVAFHSVLPYLNFLPAANYQFDSPPYLWHSFPIIDSHRWIGFDLFCAHQDVYLISLMFFLSGVFVWPSLRRKGAWQFLRDRALRLGLPFVFYELFLSPLAHYANYRVTATDLSFVTYMQHLVALPFWPSGPPWFLAELLAF